MASDFQITECECGGEILNEDPTTSSPDLCPDCRGEDSGPAEDDQSSPWTRPVLAGEVSFTEAVTSILSL